MKDRGKLLRTSEVAERLGVHTGTVAQYIRDGSLQAISTTGGHYRIYEDDLEAFLAGAALDREHGAVVISIVNQKGGRQDHSNCQPVSAPFPDRHARAGGRLRPTGASHLDARP